MVPRLQANFNLAAFAEGEATGTVITTAGDMKGAIAMAAADVQTRRSTPPKRRPLQSSSPVATACATWARSSCKARTNTTTTCTDDCPITVGECAAPTTSDVGDATVPCGGNGGCNYATLTCNCAAAYAGDSCAYCAENYIRVGDECTVSVSALQAAAEEEQPPAPSTPRVRPRCLSVCRRSPLRELRLKPRPSQQLLNCTVASHMHSQRCNVYGNDAEWGLPSRVLSVATAQRDERVCACRRRA